MGDGKKEMLRKKTHVVRKKTHVVRKFFYVASIFDGVARRRNRPPCELSSPPWTLSSTAGDFLPRHLVGGNAFNAFTEHPSFIGALIQVYRTPIFNNCNVALLLQEIARIIPCDFFVSAMSSRLVSDGYAENTHPTK